MEFRCLPLLVLPLPGGATGAVTRQMRACGGGSGIADATSVPDGHVKGRGKKNARCSGDQLDQRGDGCSVTL